MGKSNAFDEPMLLGGSEGSSSTPMGVEAGAAVLSSPFNYRPRAHQDTAFKWIYLLAALGMFIGGIVCLQQRNTGFYTQNSGDYLANMQNCPVNKQRRLLAAEPDSVSVATHVLTWLMVTLVVSVVLGFVYVQLFKRHAKVMVVAAAVMHVVVLSVTGIIFAATGAWPGAIVMFLLAVLMAAFYFFTRNALVLMGRLFSISAHGLCANSGIFGLVFCLWLSLAVVMVPCGFFMAGAMANGHVAPSPLLTGGLAGGAAAGTQMVVTGNKCFVDGEQQPCCVWEMDSGAVFYLAMLWLFILWTSFTLFQIRQFVISGTIAQWYYTPVGTPITSGNMFRSVRHALGPQFGTLALGGLILTIVELLRNVCEQLERKRNIFFWCLACMLRLLLAAVEYLTKFATIWAAISGESFLRAGREVTHLLSKNLLDSLRVWWFPPVVVAMTSLVVGLLWGVLVWLFVLADLGADNMGVAIAVGMFAGMLCLLVLQMCGSILLNIVDTVYICYALDKDRDTKTMEEVHEVFAAMPVHKEASGVVVEQPSGQLMYAPDPASQPPPPPPHPMRY